MSNPFHFGRQLPSKAFVNRTTELRRLQRNFRSGTNSVVIAPRRWGKTVLVHEAAKQAMSKDDRLRVIHMDLTTVRDEEEFARQFLRSIINYTETAYERRVGLIREFLSHLVPRLKYTVAEDSSVEFALGWEELQTSLLQVLDLPERIAKAKGLRLVVAIDEFQEVASFAKPGFDGVLRAKWQHHGLVSYCLYGSKSHMMSELFGSYKRPFYHFGDVFFLDRIPTDEWVTYLTATFARADRELEREAAERLVEYVHGHSHYVQQMAMETFSYGEAVSNKRTVERAFDSLIHNVQPIFEQLVNPLTQSQLNFLLALADDAPQLSSERIRKEYRLGSSSNVTKLKQAMQDREFAYLERGRKLKLLDPVFGTWLQRTMRDQ